MSSKATKRGGKTAKAAKQPIADKLRRTPARIANENEQQIEVPKKGRKRRENVQPVEAEIPQQREEQNQQAPKRKRNKRATQNEEQQADQPQPIPPVNEQQQPPQNPEPIPPGNQQPPVQMDTEEDSDNGEDARLPSSVTDQLIPEDQSEETLSDFKSRLMQIIKEVHEAARKRMERSQQKGEQDRMKSAKDHHFCEGDLVWLYCKQPGNKHKNKLDCPWKGPFRIVKLLEETNAELQTLGNRKLKQIVHVSRLKKFSAIRPTEDIELTTTDTFDFEKEENEEKVSPTKKEKKEHKQEAMNVSKDPTINELEVQEILGVGLLNGKLRYKVAWKNLEGFESWEIVDNMTNCQELIEEFHIKKGLICQKCKPPKRFTNKGAVRKHMQKEHKECEIVNKENR